jgi:hypothetical protein
MFFFEKTKNSCLLGAAPDWTFSAVSWPHLVRVFCFFFSKKKTFLDAAPASAQTSETPDGRAAAGR